VGLVAREIERAGIPTLCMTSAFDVTFSVRPPRAVFLNFPLNHQTGKAGDAALQRRILLDAFRAFETLWAPGQLLSLPYVWDPSDRSWEDTDWGPNFDPYGVGSAIQKGFAERKLGRAGDGAAS
jgi:hypothetical protein